MTHRYETGDGRHAEEPNTVQAATLELKQRRERTRHLPEGYFGEPAWDILLDLFVAEAGAKTIPIGSACVAGGVPRAGDVPADGPVVRITGRGKTVVDRILADRGAVSMGFS